MKSLPARHTRTTSTKSHNLEETGSRGKLTVAYRPISSLSVNPRNPRVHSAQQVRQIAQSIEAFGFNVPLLIDANGQIVSGHGRLLACKHLGMSEVPTVELAHLTEVQKQAFLLAENKLVENADWDSTLLGEQFAILHAADIDFDLTVTGFDIAEIDLLIQGPQVESTGPDPDDDPMAVSAAVSIRGDLWQLGPHRIYCGDALEASSYAVVMPNERAAVVFSDPPYNCKVSSISGKGKRQHPEFAMASGEMNRREFTDFLRRSLQLMVQHSSDGAIHFICMDFRHQSELLDAGSGLYSELKNLCVWVKNNGGMGSLYRSRHELIWVLPRFRGRLG